MKVKVAEIRDTLTVEVKGNEPWLESLYESFAQREDGTRRDKITGLTAKIRIDIIPGDVVKVSGNIQYQPLIACGKCGDDIPWPVDSKFEVYYENEFQDAELREINLSPSDLNRYYIENGKIDLESLLNEMVQLDIPLGSVRASEDGESCVVCHMDLTSPIVYQESVPEEKVSPFAVLGAKNLKH